MTIDRKWVIYNTLTGAIINELPSSEDSVYVDINNGDEATLTIPAYSLSNTDRVQWTKVFKPWARGIALIDNTKVWNGAGAVIFAGPIVKRSFNSREEKIVLTAYGIYEYLKKITVPPVWTEVTDATLTETFTADSWAGVYSAILQRGVDDTGKPTGWNFMKTFTGLPTVTGTGYSYTVKVVDQKTVAECMEDIRDNVSAHGNEYKFTPVFTSTVKDTLTWTLTVGSDAAPKLNYADLTVPLYEEEVPTAAWRANEYNVDDDNTLIYNKLVINGSTDSVTANLEAVYDLTTDPEMPGLTEKFEPGVTLTQAELDAQKAARIKGSLVGDKNVTLTISQDEALESFTMVGKKLTVDVSLSDRAAGTGVTVRAVGLRFTNTDRENNIELELMKLQARYPKLPKDTNSDMLTGDGGYDITDPSFGGGADFGNPELDYGTGGGGFDTGGETYVEPPVEPGTPEVTNPNLLLHRTSSNVGTIFNYTQYYSNITPEGYYYQTVQAPAYTNTTDTISDIIIRYRQITLDETSGIEPAAVINNSANIYTISSSTISAAMNTLPSTVSVWYAGNNSYQTLSPTVNDSNSYVTLNLWTIKNKLYILATKRRQYGVNAYTSSIAFRHEQKMFTLDINITDGTLSNFTILSTKFGPTSYANNNKVFVIPNGIVSSTGFWRSQSRNFFTIDNNNIMFMVNDVLYDYQRVANGVNSISLDLTYWDSTLIGLRSNAIKPIKVDFSNPSSPVYIETSIQHIIPMAKNTTTLTVWDGTKYLTDWVDAYAYYFRYGLTGGSTFLSYYFDPYKKKIYGQVWGLLNQEHYTEDITTLKTNLYKRIHVLDYGAGETLFSQIGNNYASLFTGDFNYTSDDGVGALLIPVGDNLYLTALTTKYTDQPSTSSRLVLKNNEWVKERSNSSIEGYNNINLYMTKTSTGKPVTLIADGGISAQQTGGVDGGLLRTFTEQLSPYKVTCKYASKYNIVDNTGKLWKWGTAGVNAGYTPTWSETDIPLKTPITTSWKQIEYNVGALGTNTATIALDSSGYLWAWGNNGAAITGQGTTTGTTLTPTQIGTKTWSKIAIGITAAAAIDTEGRLFTWGLNTTGLTAQGTSTGTTFYPTQVGTDTYVDVDMWRGLMAVTTSGQIKYAGVITGQTTVNTLTNIGTASYKRVTVGDLHYLALNTNNKLFALGSHLNGRTGLNLTTGTATTWTQVNTSDWKDINATKINYTGTTTSGASFGIQTNGELYEWGSTAHIGNSVQQNIPSKVGDHTDWISVFNNPTGSSALRENGTLYSSKGNGSETWNGTFTSTWRTIFGGETA